MWDTMHSTDIFYPGLFLFTIIYRTYDENTDKTEVRLNAFYFLPNPMAFALNHFCNDASWRLFPNQNRQLKTGNSPRTLNEFETDPRMPGFYTFRCSQVNEDAYLHIFS